METEGVIASDVRLLQPDNFAQRYPHPFLGVTISSASTELAEDECEDEDGELEGDDSDYITQVGDLVEGDVLGRERSIYALAAVQKRVGANQFSFITIGRAANNDIVIPHVSVSKCHAVLAPQGDGFTVADASSKFGTQLNGASLEANQPTLIDWGDALVLSPQVSVVFLDASTAHLWFTSFARP